MYMYMYLYMCMYTERESSIQSETSDVASASNPTKSLGRHGRPQERSSELVEGKVLLIELFSTCTLTLCV